MDKQIKENLNNPLILEKLYRSNKNSFTNAFNSIYIEISNTEIAKYWKARLDYDIGFSRVSSLSKKNNILSLIISCMAAAVLIRIPSIFGFTENTELFYTRNSGIIVFFGLSLYMILNNKYFSKINMIITAFAFIIPAVFINILPANTDSHSLNLSYIHLQILMWFIFGLVYINFNFKELPKRSDYIRFNGDLIVLYTLLAIAGMILTAITIQLFYVINIKIHQFYFEYIVMCGAVSAPVVAVFIMEQYPDITNKIAPIIAKIFSPLVSITLIIYLIVVAVSGKDPYNDREFLLVFNIMLLAVTAIIFYSVSGTSKETVNKFNNIQLLVLTIVTLIIDLVALSAIFYRLGEFGISPNKLAALGSNLLIFVNLILIIIDLFKVNFKGDSIEKVELTISRYLPVYLVWIIFVVFAFPFMFGMK